MGTIAEEISSDRTETVVVPVIRLDPDLDLPVYARFGDAGLDLLAAEDVTLEPGRRELVRTGIAVALPVGTAGFIQPRSGLAYRHGVTVLNAPGLIDCGYRDELRVLLINHDRISPFLVQRGDRIAQLVVQRVATVVLFPVESLDDTERGRGGFGSTGVGAVNPVG